MANKYIYDGEDIVSIVFDEGSVYWAIKQMIDGKVVRKKDGRTIYESCSSNDRVRLLPEVAPFHTDLDCTISMEEFIAKNLLVSDFEIYQNPKLKHSFKVGDRIVAIDNPALDYIIEKLYSVGSMPYAALRDSEGTLYGLGLFEIDTKDISSLEYDLTLKYKAYEEPKFKSGDWVELNVYNNHQGQIKKVFPAGMGELCGTRIHRTEPTFLITGLSGEFHYDTIARKLSPSEVVIHIGCLSGTVRRINDIFFCLNPSTEKELVVPEARIPHAMLDTTTAELVRELLKAQEEEK